MYQDTYSSFHEFLSAHGYTPKGAIQAGRFTRRGKNQSFSAKLFEDGLGGYLHNWRTGEKFYWFAKESSHDRNHQNPKLELQGQAEELKQREVGKQAGLKFKKLKNASSSHPYLIKKQIQSYVLKQDCNLLVIPLCGVKGDYQSLQFINPKGEKKFLSGGKMKGGCHFIGLLKMQEPIYIAEGFVTGASVPEETKSLTILAFNAENLVTLAQDLRQHLPEIEIIIAGDNYSTGKNYAEMASQIINGTVIYPPSEGLDWNDYLTHGVSV